MTPECGRARTDAQPLEQLGSTSSAGRSPTPRGPSSPSSAENDKVDVANALLRRAGETLVLPVDVVIAERAAADAPRHTAGVDDVPAGWRILNATGGGAWLEFREAGASRRRRPAGQMTAKGGQSSRRSCEDIWQVSPVHVALDVSG